MTCSVKGAGSLFAAHRILQSANRVLHFARSLVGILPSASSFLSRVHAFSLFGLYQRSLYAFCSQHKVHDLRVFPRISLRAEVLRMPPSIVLPHKSRPHPARHPKAHNSCNSHGFISTEAMNTPKARLEKSSPQTYEYFVAVAGTRVGHGGRRRRSVRHRDLFPSRSAIWLWPALDGLSDGAVHDRHSACQRSNRPRDGQRYHCQCERLRSALASHISRGYAGDGQYIQHRGRSRCDGRGAFAGDRRP